MGRESGTEDLGTGWAWEEAWEGTWEEEREEELEKELEVAEEKV